jgi:sec-independent protein translocase protein TatB
VFGVSFPEFLVLGTVALLVLGPDKLPGMLRTLGQWLAKLRKLTTEVRHQSGIDDVLRAEGLDGGLSELRGLMRGGLSGSVLSHAAAAPSPANSTNSANRTNSDHFIPDKSREYPPEGADAYGALPEDLVPGAPVAAVPAAVAAVPAAVAPAASAGFVLGSPGVPEAARQPEVAGVPEAAPSATDGPRGS